MKLQITITTDNHGTINFDYADPEPTDTFDNSIYSNYADGRNGKNHPQPPTELERAADELRRITEAVAAMTSKPIFTIDPESMRQMAQQVVSEYVSALVERSKQAKAAAAAKRAAGKA